MYLRLDDLRYKKIRRLIIFTVVMLVIILDLLVGLLVFHIYDFITPDKPVEVAESVIEEMKTIDISSREMHAVAPRPTVNQEELELLACVIYQEAGGNTCCDECRRRVADVVLNRVNDQRFPNDIYGVLTAPRQYGRFSQTGVVWPSRANSPGEKLAVDRAYTIAEEVLLGRHSELYGNGYIWQAEFKQGTEQVYHCGIYFGR